MNRENEREEWCVRHGRTMHFVGIEGDPVDGDESLHCPACFPDHQDNPANAKVAPQPARPDFWERDDVQFPRLLAEIKAAGLTPEQGAAIKASMDITSDQLADLLDRAEESFDAFKMQIDVIQGECASCGQKILASTCERASKES